MLQGGGQAGGSARAVARAAAGAEVGVQCVLVLGQGRGSVGHGTSP
jgi:hypothetical protein